MKKARVNILIILLVVTIVLLSSYGIYKSGFTNKYFASLNKLSYKLDDEILVQNYPKINLIINSSGEKLVNEDVSVTIFSSSNFKIDKVYYSYDLKKWNEFDKFKKSKSIKAKINFKETIDSPLYIRVENEKGYQSYASKTSLKIDKENPKITIRKSFDNIIVTASDNVGLLKVGYSINGINFDYENLENVRKTTFSKKYEDYNYVCIVDIANNQSEIVKISE